MTIRETIFQPAIFPEQTTLAGVDRAIRSYTGTPIVHWYRKPGVYTLNDLRWNKVTHNWKLTVRSDGTGLLEIQPTREDAVIAQLGIPGEFLQVSTVLRRKSAPAVLLGSQHMPGGSRNVIFKMLEYVKE